MTRLSSDILVFLQELKGNNNREWFTDNKSRYQSAQAELVELVAELSTDIAQFDASVRNIDPKKSVFRIYRDVRFSKNKDPYKTNLGAHIAGGSKMRPKAGYYLHIEPGACMMAGGAYLPSSEWLKAIRQEIHHNAQEFKDIINHKDFKTHFGKLQGEKLKTAPRDYSKDHPEIELLRHKSFIAIHEFEDKELLSDSFNQSFLSWAKALFPMDAYLNMAMD